MLCPKPRGPSSGVTVPTQSLYDVAARTPDTTFLVDESFLVFSGQPSLIRLLEAEPLDNMMILTSLGKSLGVPGLRLGYLYTSNARIRRAFEEFMPIWGVNALAGAITEGARGGNSCLRGRARARERFPRRGPDRIRVGGPTSGGRFSTRV